MKTFFIYLFVALGCLAMALMCFAGEVRLAWDASPSPEVTGYAIYYGTESGVYGTRQDAGTNLTCTVTNLGYGTHYFVAVAYAPLEGPTNIIESEPSNEVVSQIIAPPTNARIVIVERLLLDGTNTSELFRLRIK